MNRLSPCDKTLECCRDLHHNEGRFCGPTTRGHCVLQFGGKACGAQFPTTVAFELFMQLKIARQDIVDLKHRLAEAEWRPEL